MTPPASIATAAPPTVHARLTGLTRATGLALFAAALMTACAVNPLTSTTTTPSSAAGTATTATTEGRPAAVAAELLANAQASTAADAAQAAVVAADALAASPAGAVALDPLRPDARIDANHPSERVDLWQRIRLGFGMPDLDNDHVRSREQWFASRPDYVSRMTDRGSRYLFHIVEEVQRRGLPSELALLPFVESAFNPQAVSSARAAGMWQFMPATGRDYDLAQNLFRDDRRDVLASTRAALDYLEELHGMFGDWHLALAAYNWGQGSVQKAIARNERAGLPTDYWSLKLPAETRDYVPKLQAVKNLVAQPQAFAIELPPLENHPYFLSVAIERDIDVALATRLAGITDEEFRYLNPQMNKPVILAAGTPQILLPYDNANQFVRQIGMHEGPLASWTAWVAPRTLHPAEAARTVGMTEAQLREVNRIPARMLVRSGSTLLVPRAGHTAHDVPSHVADHAMLTLAPDLPPVRRVSFRAGKKGLTVAAVASRYKVNAAEVAQWNRVSTSARFKPGATVVVYVPRGKSSVAAAKPGRVAAVRTKSKSSAKPVRQAEAAKPVAKSKPSSKTASKTVNKAAGKTASKSAPTDGGKASGTGRHAAAAPQR